MHHLGDPRKGSLMISTHHHPSVRYVVRIDRANGTRTYKGPWTRSHCEREARAWSVSFPLYRVEVVTADHARIDFHTWSRVTANGAFYRPQVTS